MELETFFNDSDINDIYNELTIYSILKYESIPPKWQEEFKQLYENAIKNFKERNIDINILKNSNIETIKNKLNNYQKVYETVIELNREKTKEISIEIERLILTIINSEEDELNKITLLFDFITNYIEYSEDYYKYCLNVALIDDFNFNFKNNIPIEPSIQGTLVMKEGTCDDISNLIIYLGKKLNLNINKIICNYKGFLYSLNYITLKDGKNYLIDATRLIRKDKTKEECFLVSKETLNKNNDYEFKANMIKTNNYNENIPNLTNQASLIIEEISEINIITKDINYKKLKNKYTKGEKHEK